MYEVVAANTPVEIGSILCGSTITKLLAQVRLSLQPPHLGLQVISDYLSRLSS